MRKILNRMIFCRNLDYRIDKIRQEEKKSHAIVGNIGDESHTYTIKLQFKSTAAFQEPGGNYMLKANNRNIRTSLC